MNRHFAYRLRLAICATCLMSAVAFGQQPSTGLPPLGSFGGGPFDTINLANSDVHFTIPIFSRAGRGIPFNYAMSYDSLVWSPVNQDGADIWTPVTTNWGWRALTEAATGYVSYGNVDIVPSCTYNRGLDYGISTTYFTSLSYHDPTGGIHPLGAQIRVVQITSSSCGTIGTTIYPVQNAATSDNSGYIVSTSATSALGPATVNARGGIKIVTPNVGSMTGAGSVTDANGNQISISASGVITDTLGTALTIVGTPSAGTVFYTYTAPSGTSASVKFHYSQKTVQTCFQVTNQGSTIYEFPATAEYLPYEVILPDGSSYQFTYEATASAGSCTATNGAVTGRIASVTLPTGGTITYSYAGSGCGNNSNCMMQDGSPSSMQRGVGGYQSQYTRGYQSGPSSPQQTTTSITDSTGNLTKLKFSGVYQTERTAYQGTTTVLDYSYTCYNWNSPDSACPAATVTSPVQQLSRIDHPNQISFTSTNSALQTSYDATYGNVTGGKSWDFGPGSNHALLQQSSITYNTDLCSAKNICDHPTTVQVEDGNNNTVSQTNYTYDGNGNTKQIDGWVSGTTYLTTKYVYNGNGTISTVTDPKQTVTSYSYSGSSCNGAFPTGVSVGGLTASYTYNCAGGVQTKITDANGASTIMAYSDPYFWRPASVTDPFGNATYFNYYGVTNNPGGSNISSLVQTESVQSWSSSQGNSVLDRLTTMDNLGRTVLQQTLDPDAGGQWDTIQTDYNQLGQVYFVTSPYLSTAGQAQGPEPAEYWSYDALGRVLDEKNFYYPIDIHYSYNLNDSLRTINPAPSGENPKSRQTEYDVLGRVHSVCEVTSAPGSGACSQNTGQTGYFTSYTYDPLGDLTNVNQGGQTRSYSYDGLGRMLTESNPESGATTYTYDSITGSYCAGSASNSAGDLVGKGDAAGNHLCYYYDVYHRLTAIGNNNQSASNPCSRFRYDNTTPPSGINLTYYWGRMVEAKTDNCGAQADPTLTDEWFNYNAAGQMTDSWESTPGSGGYYHVTESYFPDGARNTLQGFLPSGASFSNLFTYNVDGKGRPYSMMDGSTTVWGSTSYNPADQPLTVNAGGTEAFAYDSVTGRLTSWTSSFNNQPLQAGTLTWNTNGTLGHLQINDSANPSYNQNCGYVYDDLARIQSVNCGTGQWAQSFTYDPFGNIAKSGSSSFLASYGSNNRVSDLGFQYDADGNVTMDNLSNTYSYDAYGRPNSVHGVAVTHDALGRTVEWGGDTQAVYAPDGGKFAFMNGSTLKWHINPMVAGMARVQNGDGTSYFQHADGLGSSWLGIHGYDGTIAYDHGYAPFGETVNASSTTNLNFTGQTQDTTSGIYDFLFRQYSPSQGRWLVPDPAGMAAVDITNPQTWNRYAYLANNPLNATDPLGLYDCEDDPDAPGCKGDGDEGGGIGGIIGSGFGNCDPMETLCLSNGNSFPGWGNDTFGLGCGDPAFASAHPLGCGLAGGPGAPILFGGSTGGETLGIPNGLSTGSWGFLPFLPNLSCPAGVSVLCGGIDPAMDEGPGYTKYHCDLFGPCYQGPQIKPANPIKWYLCGNGVLDNVKNYTLEGLGKGALFGGVFGSEFGPQGTLLGVAGGAIEGFFSGNATGWLASAICEKVGMYGPKS